MGKVYWLRFDAEYQLVQHDGKRIVRKVTETALILSLPKPKRFCLKIKGREYSILPIPRSRINKPEFYKVPALETDKKRIAGKVSGKQPDQRRCRARSTSLRKNPFC